MNSVNENVLVLVIDSDRTLAELTRQLLRESDGPDVQIEHATTLDDGLQRLAKGGVHLVMLNSNIAGSSSLQTYLSVLEQACGLPVVVWSNEQNEDLALSVVQVAGHESLHSDRMDGQSICQCLRRAVEQARTKESQDASLYDALTGLPNQTAFLTQLKQVHRDMRCSGRQFAVLFFNIDGFKSVNESLGHKVGDQLLIEVSRRLRFATRPGDIVGRFGADEFTILVRDVCTVRGIEAIVRRLQRSLNAPFSVGGKQLLFSASIGVAISSQNYKQSDELLRDANTALHRAKSMGKARHQIFDASMHQHAMRQMGIEGDLRRAINEEEFELYYQPFVSVETEQIVGFEALIRWQRPGHGIVLPQEIIPVAEESGLIVPLGSWVLREGCRQIHEWKTQFPGQDLNIGINVASQQISQSDLVGEVTQALRDFDVDAANVELEITESGIIENPVAAAEVMKEIRRLGVQLSIDDFGTGYSSLSQLYRFEFDILKIDRSFINQLCKEDDNSLLFVCMILRLAKDLGMNVVAEGIETEEQLRKIQELKCDVGQGYYFSRPLPRDEATELLKRSFAAAPPKCSPQMEINATR